MRFNATLYGGVSLERQYRHSSVSSLAIRTLSCTAHSNRVWPNGPCWCTRDRQLPADKGLGGWVSVPSTRERGERQLLANSHIHFGARFHSRINRRSIEYGSHFALFLGSTGFFFPSILCSSTNWHMKCWLRAYHGRKMRLWTKTRTNHIHRANTRISDPSLRALGMTSECANGFFTRSCPWVRSELVSNECGRAHIRDPFWFDDSPGDWVCCRLTCV